VAGICTAKIVWFCTSSVKLRICKNCIIVLPVNILAGVARWLLRPHNTLPCVLISETPCAIYLKFGMWGTDVGRHLHNKNRLVRTSSTKLRIRKNCIFVLPVNILVGVARQLLGPHDTLPCVLIPNSGSVHHWY